MVIGIPGKHARCWTISWKNNPIDSKIPEESFHTEVMKCGSKFEKERLYNAHRKFDKVYPDAEHGQRLKKLMFEISSDKPDNFGRPTHIQNIINTNDNKNVTIKKVLIPLVTKGTLSHLLTIPGTSLDNHSPMKPSLDNDLNVKKEEFDSEIEDFEYNTSANFIILQNDRKENCTYISYTPDFMELNGTYKHNSNVV